MKFKESKYYNIKFLGERIYKIIDHERIFTIQEYFGLNDIQKEYLREGKNVNKISYKYKLTIKDNYYELDCQKPDANLYLVFDKPVHITGKHCSRIVAPEIIIKYNYNDLIYQCVANTVIINNNCESYYEISKIKANNVYFYNMEVNFWYSQINNFFIFNKDLFFLESSQFLECIKVKCFGSCDDLRKKMLNDANFKQGIIHIE